MNNIQIPCITCNGKGEVQVPDPMPYDALQYRMQGCGTCFGHGVLIATELLAVAKARPLGQEEKRTYHRPMECPCCGSLTPGFIHRPPETFPPPTPYSMEDLAGSEGRPT